MPKSCYTAPLGFSWGLSSGACNNKLCLLHLVYKILVYRTVLAWANLILYSTSQQQCWSKDNIFSSRSAALENNLSCLAKTLPTLLSSKPLESVWLYPIKRYSKFFFLIFLIVHVYLITHLYKIYSVECAHYTESKSFGIFAICFTVLKDINYRNHSPFLTVRRTEHGFFFIAKNLLFHVQIFVEWSVLKIYYFCFFLQRDKTVLLC